MIQRSHSYPYVICDDHPGIIEPGYAVCLHVIDGAPVAHFAAANASRLGEVLCVECFQNLAILNAENFIVCCAPGVRERGWNKVAVQ